jgi:Secretion system C-terminal sorting domain
MSFSYQIGWKIMRKSLFQSILFLFMIFILPSIAKTETVEKKLSTNHSIKDLSLSLDEEEIIWRYDFEDPSGLENWIFTDPAITTQENYWSIDDWKPINGSNSWRCFDPTIGATNMVSYGENWIQLLTIPAQDFSDVNTVKFNFLFRCMAEATSNDGATIIVVYGSDEINLQYAIPTPDAGYGDFDQNSIEAFAPFWPNMEVAGWKNSTNSRQATFDLSEYSGYEYVRISFAFASTTRIEEGGFNNNFGFQVDDISLDLDGTITFADDADGHNIGGELFFINGEAASTEIVPNIFGLFEPRGCSSPTHALGIEAYNPNWDSFEQYAECPDVFNVPILSDNEFIYFDFQLMGDWNGEGIFPNVPFWSWEYFDPRDQMWHMVSYGNGINNLHTDAPESWSTFEEAYNIKWNLNSLSGIQGVRFRCCWHNQSDGIVDDYFGGMYWDDLTVYLQTLESDIETRIGRISYPTTMGYPVVGEVSYSNYGISGQTGVGIWGLNVSSWPVYPDGTSIFVPPGRTNRQYISTINSGQAYWIPTVAGATTITARFVPLDDENPDNDIDSMTVEVLEMDHFELGYDQRIETHYSTAFAINEGPLTHFTPVDDGLIPHLEHETYWMLEYQFMWYGDYGDGDIRIHILDGGDSPGEEIWQSEVISCIADSSISELIVDLSGIEELFYLDYDFYVWTELLSENESGVAIPSPLCTIEDISDHHYNYDGITATETSSDWRVNVVIWENIFWDPITNIHEDLDKSSLPAEFEISDLYPNPFNPTLNINVSLPETTDLKLSVFNIMGQEVATVANGQYSAGIHNFVFDANEVTSHASGIYFVQASIPGKLNQIKKVVLMK